MRKIIILSVILLAGINTFAQSRYQYQGEILAGYAFLISASGADRINIETIHGVKIGDHFFGGIGIGQHIYRNKRYDYRFMPIFANIKVYVSEKMITRYFSLDVGYGIAAGDTPALNGFYLSPAVGLRFKLSHYSSNAITLSLGYQSQSTKRKLPETKLSDNSDAIALKVGFTF